MQLYPYGLAAALFVVESEARERVSSKQQRRLHENVDRSVSGVSGDSVGKSLLFQLSGSGSGKMVGSHAALPESVEFDGSSSQLLREPVRIPGPVCKLLVRIRRISQFGTSAARVFREPVSVLLRAVMFKPVESPFIAPFARSALLYRSRSGRFPMGCRVFQTRHPKLRSAPCPVPPVTMLRNPSSPNRFSQPPVSTKAPPGRSLLCACSATPPFLRQGPSCPR